jgi:hypothetical protein
MKKIVYHDNPKNKEFFLTNKEFEEAYATFQRRKEYWCARLQASLSHRYKWIETPPIELEYTIFYLPTSGGVKQIYKKGNKYYQEMESEEKTSIKEIILSEEEKNNLLSEEEVYHRKKLSI